MIEHGRGDGEPADWDGSWDESRRQQLRRALGATPAQRLAWLEDAIEFAHQAGALSTRSRESAHSSGSPLETVRLEGDRQ